MMKNMTILKSAEVIPFPESKRNKAVVKAVKSAMDQKMTYLFDGLLLNASTALFEEMWSLDREEMLARRFNVMRFLKVHGDHYELHFCQVIDELWDQLGRSDAQRLSMPEGPVSELIRINSRKLESHYKVLITEIRLRLSYMIGKDVSQFPIQPENLYIAFWQTTLDSKLSYHESFTLIMLFHRFVMDRYGQILAAVNETLIDHRVDVSSA
jgi:hypothetical protein